MGLANGGVYECPRRGSNHRDPNTRSNINFLHLLAAVLSSLLAIYNFSAGFAVLPVAFILLMFNEITLKRKITFMTLWACFSLIVLFHFYLVAFVTRTSIGENLIGFNPIELSIYILNYIGGSIARFAEDLAPIFSFLSFFILWKTLKYLLKNKVMKKEQIMPYFGLCLFAFFCSLATGIGRIHMGTDHAFVSRYISFSNLFWVGFFIISTRFILSVHTGKFRTFVKYFLIILLLFKTGNIVSVGNGNAEKFYYYKERSKILATEYPNVDDDFVLSFYWGSNVRNGRRNLDILKKYKLNIFSGSD